MRLQNFIQKVLGKKEEQVEEGVDPINIAIAQLWAKGGDDNEKLASLLCVIREEIALTKTRANTATELVKNLHHQLSTMQSLIAELSKEDCKFKAEQVCWSSSQPPRGITHDELPICFSCKARYIIHSLKLTIEGLI